MNLAVRSTLDPQLSRTALHLRCQSAVGRAPDDGAGVHVMDCRAGSCQRFARNRATRSLTPPHDPTLGSAAHLRGCVETRGAARRCEPPAHRWHARGQGFKSPQLHPRSQALSTVDRLRIARLGQQIGSNLYRHGPIRSSGAAGRGRVPSCPRPVDRGAPGRRRVGRSRRRTGSAGRSQTVQVATVRIAVCAGHARPSGPKVSVHLSWCSHALTSTLSPNEYPFGVAGALSGERLAVLLFSPMPTVTDNRGRHHSGLP